MLSNALSLVWGAAIHTSAKAGVLILQLLATDTYWGTPCIVAWGSTRLPTDSTSLVRYEHRLGKHLGRLTDFEIYVQHQVAIPLF